MIKKQVWINAFRIWSFLAISFLLVGTTFLLGKPLVYSLCGISGYYSNVAAIIFTLLSICSLLVFRKLIKIYNKKQGPGSIEDLNSYDGLFSMIIAFVFIVIPLIIIIDYPEFIRIDIIKVIFTSESQLTLEERGLLEGCWLNSYK